MELDLLVQGIEDNYVVDTPYLEKKHNDTNAVLDIPTFNYSYDGTYTCGIGNNYPPGAPNATVSFIIGSK